MPNKRGKFCPGSLRSCHGNLSRFPEGAPQSVKAPLCEPTQVLQLPSPILRYESEITGRLLTHAAHQPHQPRVPVAIIFQDLPHPCAGNRSSSSLNFPYQSSCVRVLVSFWVERKTLTRHSHSQADNQSTPPFKQT